MSTFDPKKKKGFAGEDRRGDYIWRLRPEIIDALGALSR